MFFSVCSVMKDHPLLEKAAVYVASIVNEEHAREPARAARSKREMYTHARTRMHTHTCTHGVYACVMYNLHFNCVPDFSC